MTLSALAFCLLLAPLDGPAAPCGVQLQLEFHQPGEQLEAALRWFHGTPHHSPADLLATVRTRLGKADVLPRAVQAGIAFLNPDMVPELRLLDGATARIEASSQKPTRWWLAAPRDDGTLSAFGTALSLGDGALLPAADAFANPTEQLGKPGAPLLQRLASTILLGSDPDALRQAADYSRSQAQPEPGAGEPGIAFEVRLLPPVLGDEPPADAGFAHAIDDLGISSLTGRSWLHDDGWSVVAHAPLAQPNEHGSLEPAQPSHWLDETRLRYCPADACLFTTASLDPSGRSLRALFGAIEVGLRLSGRFKGDASLRARASLLATAAGYFPDFELWPRLDGLAAWMQFQNGLPVAAEIWLHPRQREHAVEMTERLKSLWNRAFPPGEQRAEEPGAHPASPTRAFKFEPTAVQIVARADLIVLRWSQLPAEATAETPGLSPELLAADCVRQTLVWPVRFFRHPTAPSPLGRAFESAAPIVWTTRLGRKEVVEELHWKRLPAAIRSIVSLLEREPNPR